MQHQPDPHQHPPPEELPAVAAHLLDTAQQHKDRLQLIENYLDTLDQHSQQKKPPNPRPWTLRATLEEWQELADWADWMLRTYEPANEYTLAPCWPAHKGAVEHLAALLHAWQAAMAQDENKFNDASAYWHKNWLWPVLADITKTIPNSCRNGTHRPAERRTQQTDRSHLPAQHAHQRDTLADGASQ